MSFQFHLSCPSGSIASPLASEPLQDDHDYEYLVMQACRILSDAGCRFHMEGFGSADWGFDVSYDLSTFIEQLPDLIDGLESNGVGEVDFYSQGIERTVSFRRAGGSYELRCLSRTSWRPSPATEYENRAALESMLNRSTFDFSTSLQRVSSAICDLDPFYSWRTARESGHI
jgi:hypothetical protein